VKTILKADSPAAHSQQTKSEASGKKKVPKLSISSERGRLEKGYHSSGAAGGKKKWYRRGNKKEKHQVRGGLSGSRGAHFRQKKTVKLTRGANRELIP